MLRKGFYQGLWVWALVGGSWVAIRRVVKSPKVGCNYRHLFPFILKGAVVVLSALDLGSWFREAA